MQVGDIVKPKDDPQIDPLTSGCSRYDDAIVVSVDPFVLVSRETDMRWQCTVKPQNFQVTGKATTKQLDACMRRL